MVTVDIWAILLVTTGLYACVLNRPYVLLVLKEYSARDAFVVLSFILNIREKLRRTTT